MAINLQRKTAVHQTVVVVIKTMENKTAKEHWENIYSTKQANEVSWLQHYQKTFIEFVEMYKPQKDAAIIDIGGGDSCLVDALPEKDFSDITVLDISANAIERAKFRIGKKAKLVKRIVSDATDFMPTERYDFWHDRAAFHFLTTEEKVNEYVPIASNAINQHGNLVLGTFSESGPKKCSGLDIKQYFKESISLKFEKDFKRILGKTEDHETPFNTMQNFLYCSFQKEKQ